MNTDPYGDGWLLVIDPTGDGLYDLLSAEEYEGLTAGG